MPMIKSGGAFAPFKYAPDEIQNSMFLPLIKKKSWEVIGADAETSLYLVIKRYSNPPPPPASPCCVSVRIFFIG